jgi:hypothetical protein
VHPAGTGAHATGRVHVTVQRVLFVALTLRTGSTAQKGSGAAFTTANDLTYLLPSLLSLSLSHFSFFETKSHSIAQAGLKFAVFLPQTPKCWDYGNHHTQLRIFCLLSVLAVEPRAIFAHVRQAFYHGDTPQPL